MIFVQKYRHPVLDQIHGYASHTCGVTFYITFLVCFASLSVEPSQPLHPRLLCSLFCSGRESATSRGSLWCTPFAFTNSMHAHCAMSQDAHGVVHLHWQCDQGSLPRFWQIGLHTARWQDAICSPRPDWSKGVVVVAHNEGDETSDADQEYGLASTHTINTGKSQHSQDSLA